MNKRYYTIIRRDEFINLYKYGSIKINSCFIILEENNLEKEIIKLLKFVNLTEDEEYIVLEFLDEACINHNILGTIETLYDLKIQSLKNVYTLSNKAQNFYSTKFNPKINFKILPYLNVLKEVKQYNEYKDMSKGVDILFNQFELGSRVDTEPYFYDDLKKDFLNVDNYLEKDFKSIYLELLFYKRENKFAKEDISFIFDLIIVTLLKERKPEVINRFKQGELKLNSSPTYNILLKNKKDNLYSCIEFINHSRDSNLEKFIEKIDKSILIIGSIFFKLKYLLSNKPNNYTDEMKQLINDFKTSYKKELCISLYLIGIVFGYKNLYKDYYENINLNIFYQKIEEIKNESHSETKIPEKEQNNNDEGLLKKDEIKNTSLAELKRLAKEVGVKGVSKYKSNDTDKLKLYQEIINHKKFLNV